MALSAKNLLEYQQKLNKAANENSSDLFFNDSILHAMIIMKEILNKAANEPGKCVSMYCGKFSLFRESTEQKILAEKLACETKDLDAVEKKRWTNLNFFSELRNALKEFLNEDGHLRLILEYDIDQLKQDSLWSIIQPAISKKQLNVYALTSNIGLDHFVTTEQAYRVENSDEMKTAICCFGDRTTASVLNDNFKMLLSFSKPIEFN